MCTVKFNLAFSLYLSTTWPTVILDYATVSFKNKSMLALLIPNQPPLRRICMTPQTPKILGNVHLRVNP